MTAETTLGRKLIVLVFGLAVGALLLSILGGSMIWVNEVIGSRRCGSTGRAT